MRDKYIKVYSSVGALIATFANDAIDEAANKKEQLYNPHVEIDEDSSTATFDIFKDSDAWAKIAGEDKIYEIDGRRYFIYGEPAETSDANMVHVTLKELWHELDAKFVQAYNVSGNLEFIGEYSVVLMPFSESGLYVNGELKSNPYTKDNLGYYIWSLLQGSGYTLAYCNVVDTTYDAVNLLSAYQLDTEGISILENLKSLKELTDCILKWDTINKTLSVYDKNVTTSEINKWQGYEIREGVNAVKGGISKRKNTNIITRVIPYGYDNLIISTVNSGLVYLDDNSYSDKVYAKIIVNQDIQTPHALKVWAQKELAKICKPTVEYEADFVLRSDEDYAHETCNLYDIVRVIYYDKEVGTEITDNQRIISLKYDVWKKSAFKSVLGDKKIRWEQRLKKSVENGVKIGQVLSTSGTISSGSVYYGSGVTKKRLSSVLGGIESSIATIETTADNDRANVELLSLFVNSAKGVKTVQDYSPETWEHDYIYYVSQGAYTGYWKWDVSEWVLTQPMSSTLATIGVTADRAVANIELLAKYTSSVDEIVEVADTSGQVTWDVGYIYYVTSTDKFYKHNGTAWAVIDQMTTQIASIQTTANANSSKIALVVEQVEGVDVIKTASIVTAINDAGSTITIDADKINFVGFTTFLRGADYLTAGQTTIDGGKLTANTITADKIDATDLEVAAANVTGTLTVGQLPSTLALKADVPTKVSNLMNDSGFVNSGGVTTICDNYIDASFISSKGIVITDGGNTIFSAVQTGSGGSVTISPSTLEISVVGGSSVIDLGAISAGYITGSDFGSISLYGYSGISLSTPEGDVSTSGDLSVGGSLGVYATLGIDGYSDVASTLDDYESRIAALELLACITCDTCLSCDVCLSCDTCQVCNSCDNCDTCQSCDTCQDQCMICEFCDGECTSDYNEGVWQN